MPIPTDEASGREIITFSGLLELIYNVEFKLLLIYVNYPIPANKFP